MEEIYSHENKTHQNNDSAMKQFILCILCKLNKIQCFILQINDSIVYPKQYQKVQNTCKIFTWY